MAKHWRTGVLLATVLAGFAGSPGTLAQQPQPDGQWPRMVWSAAEQGRYGAFVDLLTKVPADPADPGAARLAESIKLLETNIVKREASRAEQIAKAGQELDRHLQEKGGDAGISEALKSAVELHMLSIDKAAFLAEPRTRRLIADADAAARAAEARGDWLMTNELFYRLDLLLEEPGTYKDEVRRQASRLSMVRLYTPAKFWKLRNDRRSADIERQRAEAKTDEERAKVDKDNPPLPPYNPVGDDYHDKLAGVTDEMVVRAIKRSYDLHVEREKTTMAGLLRGGLEAVRTMVTTADLREAFPGLADESARAKFLDFISAQEAALKQAGAGAGFADLASIVGKLEDLNDETVKIHNPALMHEFGNGAMSTLDEFSAIIWPDEVPRFQKSTQGRFTGVGIQIQLDELANIKVVTPLEGTPAQRAGVRAGDVIKKVNGESAFGFTLDQAVDVITGPENTEVTLTMEREVEGSGKVEIEFPLKRSRIDVATVKGWRRLGAKEDQWDWFVDADSRIGYVRLTQFADRTDQEFDRAIAQMKEGGLKALILDLRFNPGGLLDQAVEISNRFINPGARSPFNNVIVSTRTAGDKVVSQEFARAQRASLVGLPVVVLINEGSASASEIVSGAIQDYAREGDVRAVLVGERSYGKGSVQNVWQLAGARTESLIKLTTQYYKLPGGRLIHRRAGAHQWGIDPNLEIDMLPQQITDALTLRTNADVLTVDQNNQVIPNKDGTPNPDDLIAKGSDLQLETAVVLLQTQVARAEADQAMLDKPNN